MPCLQAAVRPLAAGFMVKIADFTSRLQDNCTIAARFFTIFPTLKWSQRIICMQINFYDQLVAEFSPNNL